MSDKHFDFDVVIIGSGPAGWTAAVYTSRAGFKTGVIQGSMPGGQLATTTDVENYPGFSAPIQGPWLMNEMSQQAQAFGTEIFFDTVCSVLENNGIFVCTGNSGSVYNAKAIIIATGARSRKLGITGEDAFLGYGVSTCAVCDGFFFKGKEVVIIGGGNAAVEEAMYLSKHASHVTLIHRRDKLRAEMVLQNRLFSIEKISVIWNTTVKEIIGINNPKRVEKILLKSAVSGEEICMKVHGVFVAIGHIPNTTVFKDWIALDNEGYILTQNESRRTNIRGVFAAGDVQDKVYRQAITAAGSGCQASLEVVKFLEEKELRD